MNDTDLTPHNDSFLPLVLISLSLIFTFIWQLTNISQQRNAYQASQQSLEQAFNAATPQHEQMIAQSKQVQAQLEKLVLDLIDLAKSGDEDAKAIITKYDIRQQGAATPAPSASGTAK